jgi:hypothetical protein
MTRDAIIEPRNRDKGASSYAEYEKSKESLMKDLWMKANLFLSERAIVRRKALAE